MPLTIPTELSLPAKANMQRLVQDYVRGLAQLAGFSEAQAETYALAVWEACRNAIEHAFEGGESGTLKITGELTPAALTLSVRDNGLPFYQTQGGSASDADIDRTAPVPRRLASVQQCFDQVRRIYHGVEGNELRLTKYLAERRPLPDMVTETPPLGDQDVRSAPPGDYTIRLLRPGDGKQVSQLIYRAYGYTYPHEDFYYPEWIDHEVATGRLVGVVAVTDRGEIVGHVGVERSAAALVGNVGFLVVAPAHRGQGISRFVNDRLYEEIRQLGLVGLINECFTIHTITQQFSDGLGQQVTCISLLELRVHLRTERGLSGSGELWEQEVAPGRQRLTLVDYFTYLRTQGLKTLYAPTRHREILAQIYRNLEVEVQFLEPGHPMGPGELKVYYNQAMGTGTIQVNRIGSDTLPEICRARRDLCDLAGAQVVGLNLPLAQGGTPDLCEAAEADGFFFSGLLLPCTPDGDYVRLQYLNTELDPASIHLYSPFAKELLGYILKERARVGR
jgi:anti-sigma regulatory factor (Ser/Thr protein kinase)/GNAT superfamily N-acetyltransferase